MGGNGAKKKARVSKRLADNIAYLHQALGVADNFDIITRELKIGGKEAVLLFVDGLSRDEVLLYLIWALFDLPREELQPLTLSKIVKEKLPYAEIQTLDTLDDIVDTVLAGPQVLLVDGLEQGIVIDARIYPFRNIQEPDLERVVRGSRDGFTETLVYNTALIRRRIRDPRLRFVVLQVGVRSKTDICLAYLEDVANPELVAFVRNRLEEIRIDGLPMAEKSVEELITPGSYWNPFPKVRYTERPDVAAVHLLEGHLLVLVDTSPSVMILPATFFSHIQHAEEYRQSPFVGAYLRWVRFLAILASTFLLPVWLLVALEPRLLPAALKFIGPAKAGKVPLFGQFLLAEIAVDILRMAAIHIPSPLATALGIIAAVLLGEIAIRIGLFNGEVVLYTAVAAIGTFATPSYELSMANRLVRLGLVFLVGIWRVPGLLVGLLLAIFFMLSSKSFGIPYFWPLIPFNWDAFKQVLLRYPVPLHNLRPSVLKPQDVIRQPSPALKPEEKKGSNWGEKVRKTGGEEDL
ncbi:MAG: spore germination protein [Firmicutes bacterium]|nr:spore germination protein [Bacillota bacterium]